MPEEIVSRILRLPGYGVYGWETDEAANTLTLSIRQEDARRERDRRAQEEHRERVKKAQRETTRKRRAKR
jgi:hypothetical protein